MLRIFKAKRTIMLQLQSDLPQASGILSEKERDRERESAPIPIRF